MKRTELQRKTPLARGRKPLNRSVGKSGKSRRRPISPASKAQRDKVRDQPCAVCGREASDYVAIDPMHLWARGRGGCDHPDCVVPGCRTAGGGGCHPALDRGELNVLPSLVPRFAVELGHALVHAEGNLEGLYRRLTGERFEQSNGREADAA